MGAVSKFICQVSNTVEMKPGLLTISTALRMFFLASPTPSLLSGGGWRGGGTWRGTQDEGEGREGHMSSLPGPEPCCWLHRSLSQPRTKISLDTASDRQTPADADAHRHTEKRLLSLSPDHFLHFSNSRFLPASPPLPVTTHSHWPLGPGQVP